jgi:integrase
MKQMNEVVKTPEELTDLYAYHHKTSLNLVISDSLILNHESLRREARIDFKEMVVVFSQEAVEALRFEFVSCVSQGYALSTISTYILKTNELIRLVKKAGVVGAGPVKTLCAPPQLWKVFWEWLDRNRNYKTFIVRWNGDAGLLWSDQYGSLINALPSQSSRERAARSADPYSGALTESEVRDVTFGVCKGYEQGLLHIEHLATYFLALLLGYRHSQIINLKVQDLTYSEELKSWRLKVEMIKQKNKSAPVYIFVRLPVLVNTLLDYLVPLCKARGKDYLIHRTTSYSGCHIPEELIRELPNKKCIGSVLLGRVQEVIYSLGVRTPRVEGGLINLNFIRFKHTLLTRAAVNGATAHELMYLGMHSDITSARSYIDSIPAAQARIREELGVALTSIAQVFLGAVYEGGYEKAILEMPDSIKRHYGIAGAKPIGVCGSNVNCTDHAPVACLMCPKFKPFRDAPFGEYKDYLILECENQPSYQVKQKIQEYIQACDMWVKRLS